MAKQEPTDDGKNEQKPRDYGSWGGKKQRGGNPRFIGSSKGPLRLGRSLVHLNLTAADFGVVVNQDKQNKED